MPLWILGVAVFGLVAVAAYALTPWIAPPSQTTLLRLLSFVAAWLAAATIIAPLVVALTLQFGPDAMRREMVLQGDPIAPPSRADLASLRATSRRVRCDVTHGVDDSLTSGSQGHNESYTSRWTCGLATFSHAMGRHIGGMYPTPHSWESLRLEPWGCECADCDSIVRLPGAQPLEELRASLEIRARTSSDGTFVEYRCGVRGGPRPAGWGSAASGSEAIAPPLYFRQRDVRLPASCAAFAAALLTALCAAILRRGARGLAPSGETGVGWSYRAARLPGEDTQKSRVRRHTLLLGAVIGLLVVTLAVGSVLLARSIQLAR
jgi:hypothetical protein